MNVSGIIIHWDNLGVRVIENRFFDDVPDHILQQIILQVPTHLKQTMRNREEPAVSRLLTALDTAKHMYGEKND